VPAWKTIKCPSCAAPLEIEESARRTRCAYCGSVSEAQAATGLFQVVRDVEVQTNFESVRVERVETSRPSSRVVPRVLGLALLLAGLGFGLWKAGLLGGSGAGLLERMQWSGQHQPIVLDVNGDGRPEVLGVIRIYKGESYAPHAAAFEGDRRLWAVELAPDLADAHAIRLGLTGGRLVAALPSGSLLGLDPGTGAELFRLSLPERVKNLCAGPNDGLRVELADERVLALDAARGETRPAGKAERNAPCGGAWLSSSGDTPTTRALGWPRVTLEERFKAWPHRPGRPGFSAEGLSVDWALEDLQAGVVYGLGQREVGTPVPGLVALEPGSGLALWKVELPVREPLQAGTRPARALGVGGGRVAAVYEMNASPKGWRLACFQAKDGVRLWDVLLPESETGGAPDSVVIAGDRVYVAHWTWLRVFDLADGRLVMTLGRFI
jgi:hypothetical protein